MFVKRNTKIMAARKQMGLNSGWYRRRLVVGGVRVIREGRHRARVGSGRAGLNSKISGRSALCREVVQPCDVNWCAVVLSCSVKR